MFKEPSIYMLNMFVFDTIWQDATELENSKSNFVEVVHAILEDPEERQRFYKVRRTVTQLS